MSDLQRKRTLTELVAQQGVTLDDIVEALTPQQDEPRAPAKLAKPVKVTRTQKAAIDKLVDRLGSVVPGEKRELTLDELADLVGERLLLDTVFKLLSKRKDDIKQTIHNHFDEKAEREGREGPRHDKDGYLMLADSDDTGTGKRWTREVKEGRPTLNSETLRQLVLNGVLTEEEYESLTVTVRVPDEDAVIAAVRKDPDLLGKLRDAIEPGAKTVSVWVRNEE